MLPWITGDNRSRPHSPLGGPPRISRIARDKLLGNDRLQKDATLPLATIAERVGVTATPCWRRIQRLEVEGHMLHRVALLDAKKLNLAVTVFVAVRTDQHSER